MNQSRTLCVALCWLALLFLPSWGCSGGSSDSTENAGGGSSSTPKYLSIGTAPFGGAFAAVGGAVSEVLNANQGGKSWTIQAQGTKGSRENIRLLDRKEIDFAMSNAAITYFAARGESGWDKKYDVRAVMTLAPNIAMFITKADSGVKAIADLKRKRVVVGPQGAGFEMFLGPILKAHSVTYDDFTPLNTGQSDAVDLISDNSAAAAFLGGAVPTSSIVQACSTHNIHFIPFEEGAKTELVKNYAFFQPATIPKDKYSDLTADFHGLNVGSMHIITTAQTDEQLVYDFTKTIYENRAQVIEKHPAGRTIKKNAALQTGVEFHPGAIRFYREIGIWRDSAASNQGD